MEYVIECGNFGRKDSDNNTMIMIMSHGRGIRGFFNNLQERGVNNWKNAQRYSWLKPFAWIYQLFRYLNKGVQKGGLKRLQENINASKRRNELLDELGLSGYSSRERMSDHCKKS